ncbi:MAG: hypothetical protein KI790_07765 [Cyclobacteriaceae bacterium]|nr:hypothetical protein [Cyclobacteriaceae bacterium HetDA_MAG_MS6]
MWKASRLLILALVTWTQAISQPYGNEWVETDQDYFKLKVAEDGWYRVNAVDLQTLGFPLSTVPASRIRMFRRGREMAINVNSNGDGTLNFLEFYGQRNDGASDVDLYLTPESQPHQYYNLFADSATYFLTWSVGGANGLRTGFSSAKDNSGLSIESYHLLQDLTLQTSQYSEGFKYGFESTFTSSFFDQAEGWTGPSISKNGNQEFNLILQDAVRSGPVPTLEIVMIGDNTLSHRVEVAVGPDNLSLRSLGFAEFSNRTSFKYQSSLSWDDIGVAGDLLVRLAVLGVSGQADRVSFAYVDVTYPSGYSLAGDQTSFDLRTEAGDRSYLRIPAVDPESTRFYDITDPFSPVLIAQTNFASDVDIVVTGTSTPRKVLALTDTKQVPVIEPYSFEDVDVGANYHIITHSDLRSGTTDQVQAYADYRLSTSGGSFDVSIAETQQLYDLFSFGDPSPLAISRYLEYLYDQGNPEYLFIIGKGTSVNFDFYRTPGSLIHYVPTFGLPGSDFSYSVNLGPDPNVPVIPTGRLSARTPEDIEVYLNKVIEMEGLAFDDLWRKNIIQLSGGQTSNELATFRSFIESFARLAEGDFLGANVLNKGKATNAVVEQFNLTEEINSGVGMVTFFGHSGSAVTDIEIGAASDYANNGRYPFLLINGCNAGEIFGTNVSFGEDWISQPSAGALGFVAHSNFALSSNLKRYTDIFYAVNFAEEEWFGTSIGEALIEISDRYLQAYGSGVVNLTQVHQMLLQGDPAIKIFGADQPDYELVENDVLPRALEGDRILSSQSSFALDLIVRNYGKSSTDSLKISISRTLPDGEEIIYINGFERIPRLDTISFEITNDPTKNLEGINLFEIRVDPDNDIVELSEINNLVNFSLALNSGNSLPLFPPDESLVSTAEVLFKWQSIDPLEGVRSFDFELDTIRTFDSPFKKTLTETGEVLFERTLDLSSDNIPDSTTMYWRTRYTQPQANEDTSWVESSFTYMAGATEGWGQFDRGQLGVNDVQGVEIDQVTGAWDFVESTNMVEVFTFGTASSFDSSALEFVFDGIDMIRSTAPIDPFCTQNTINLVAFDRETASPYQAIPIIGPDVLDARVCGRRPQMVYNFIEDFVIGPNRFLDTFIDNLKSGDNVIIFSMGEVRYSNWDATVKSKLNNVGIQTSTIDGLIDGQAVIFIGRKGFSPGEAIEVIDDGSSIPILQQSLRQTVDVVGKFQQGEVLTPRIGPARSWNSLDFGAQDEASDDFAVDIIGVTAAGTETPLFQSGRIEAVDLSTVDAAIYPQIRLRYTFSDSVNQTPPALRFWEVTYDYPPDGILLIGNKTPISIQEGTPITQQVSFINTSPKDFTDSVQLSYQIQTVDGGGLTQQSANLPGPAAGDTSTFSININSIGKVGINNLSLSAMASEVELYQNNNNISFPAFARVQADNVNPILDVTFDGSYILDGDIVSANPSILIRLRDDNPILVKSDTSGVELQLKQPCESCGFERVSFDSPSVVWTPATETEDFEVRYDPGPLEDGQYGFRVEATDESGNSIGDVPYEINFEVISESSITHFYPYPNPFSSSTRFVFTLTGSEIPDQLKIQIMTVSGRIVREITQDEIGAIHIGNNITDYAWNGTDEFGDELANGVYLYRVITRINGENVKNRGTSADRAFKNGFGKLYILR